MVIFCVLWLAFLRIITISTISDEQLNRKFNFIISYLKNHTGVKT
jgi:hypothetical protein